MKRFLLATATMLIGGSALAADLPTKARPLAQLTTATPCTNTRCVGWHVDFNAAASGTGVNILNLGAANANGTLIGAGGGYQYYDGMYWVGAKVAVTYNVGMGSDPADAAFSDKLFAFEGVELGGNLFGMLGLAPPVAPNNSVISMLAAGIPTAEVGACQKHGMTGYCAGATLHYFLPNTPLELAFSYLNGQFSGGTALPTVTETSDNMGIASVKYHF